MFKDVKTRAAMWVIGVLAAVALMPASAAADEYGSEQQSVDSYSVNCGHLGTSCEDTSANRARKKARKACARKARTRTKRRSAGVRAYAALPNGNKHSSRRKARCARKRR